MVKWHALYVHIVHYIIIGSCLPLSGLDKIDRALFTLEVASIHPRLGLVWSSLGWLGLVYDFDIDILSALSSVIPLLARYCPRNGNVLTI